jgi:hypothetical protein
MSNELSTSITLFAAQNAGCNGNAFVSGLMAPGAVAAAFVLLLILGIGLLSWLFDAITDHDDYYLP